MPVSRGGGGASNRRERSHERSHASGLRIGPSPRYDRGRNNECEYGWERSVEGSGRVCALYDTRWSTVPSRDRISERRNRYRRVRLTLRYDHRGLSTDADGMGDRTGRILRALSWARTRHGDAEHCTSGMVCDWVCPFDECFASKWCPPRSGREADARNDRSHAFCRRRDDRGRRAVSLRIAYATGRKTLWYNAIMKSEREIQIEIDRIFEEADLSGDDRELWRARLSVAGGRLMAVFVDSFSGESDLLRFFTRDLRKRIDADGDRSKLDAILAEEKEYFTGLLQQTQE
jgi:hypothetical protein